MKVNEAPTNLVFCVTALNRWGGGQKFKKCVHRRDLNIKTDPHECCQHTTTSGLLFWPDHVLQSEQTFHLMSHCIHVWPDMIQNE